MRIIRPKDIKNIQYYFIGTVLIILNYIRHSLFGYKTPRTFSINEIDRSVDYDFKVVDEWLEYLCSYSRKLSPLENKVIMELGPGPDLGIGLILLALGVKKYIALDVNELAKSVPSAFYDKLFERLKDRFPDCDIGYLKEQLSKCYKKEDAAISYIVDKNFGVSKITDKVDIIFSQAAFEHFTNVGKTFLEISSVLKEGGYLITVIDLKTHTGWIRDRDPLNIYRYSDFFWDLFKFKGSPNRIRAFEYKNMLGKNGWFDIRTEPLAILEEEYLEKVKLSLNKKFRNMDSSEMKVLTIVFMAKKK